MHKQIKWVKWFVLAFATGALFSYNYGPGLSASIFGVDQSSTYDGYDMETAIEKFHLSANDKVNEFLERLLDPTLTDNVVYPPNDSECTEENVSTYCLAVALNENLTQFEIYLQKNQNTFATSLTEGNEGITLDDAFEIAASQRSTVDEQILLAEDTIDLTLAVYNQVQLVYPVHKEMLTLIQNLDDYRGNLADIRNVLELYPAKFNGVSTASCK